jgi:hemerythrin-like metal-binding protein
MPHAQAPARHCDPANDRLDSDAMSAGSPGYSDLAWMALFETGIEELDAWHRDLVHQCNSLLGAARTTAPWDTVIEKADALAKSCVDHFLFEEALMASNSFPRSALHREEHRRITAKLWWLADAIRFSDGTGYRDRALPGEFKTILLDVMVRHDLDYRAHFQNHPRPQGSASCHGYGQKTRFPQ